MAPKRKLLLKIAVAVVLIACVAGVIVIRSTRFQIAYHDWQMRRAYNSCFRPSRFTSKMRAAVGEDGCERFEYHLRKLKLLGTVSELKFRLRHILYGSRAAVHFENVVYDSKLPGCIEFDFPSVNRSEPVELTVWCYAEDAESWNRFIAARDVPDQESDVLDENENERATE